MLLQLVGVQILSKFSGVQTPNWWVSNSLHLGSEANLARELSLRGTKFTDAFGPRSTFAVTTNIETASTKFKGKGVVFEGALRRSDLIKQTLETSTESEYFVRYLSNEFKTLR